MDKRNSIRSKIKVFRLLIIVIFILLAGIMAILIIGKMEDTVDAMATLEGIRDYELKPAVTAQISEILKNEGDKVKKDDILLKLNSRALEDRIVLVESAIRELKAEITVKTDALNILRRDPLPKEYRHVSIALDESKKRFEKSKKELEVYRKLYERTVVTRKEFHRVEMEHLENTATLEKLTNDYEKVKNGLGKKIIEKSENELQLLKYRLAGKEKELGLLEFHRDDYVIKAPEDGIVSFIPPKPGGYAESGGTVARVAAVEQKKFVALVDEKQIYKVKVGQKVRIVSSLYNYLEYGYFYGKVISIRELPEKHPKGYLYPVKIVVTHEPYALKLGSSAEVSIITGRERIISNLLGWNK